MLDRSAVETVYKLHRQLEQLNIKFVYLANSLDQIKPRSAIDLTKEVEQFSMELLTFSREGIAKAELGLFCCSLRKAPKEPSFSFLAIIILVAVGFVAVYTYFYFVRPLSKQQKSNE